MENTSNTSTELNQTVTASDNSPAVNEVPDNTGKTATPVYSQMSLEFVANQVKRAKRKGFLLGLFLTLGIVILCVVGIITFRFIRMINDGSLYANMNSYTEDSLLDKETVKKINSIYGIMENTYIEKPDKEAIREGIYKGMLDSLGDPYSVYYTKEEYEEMMESSSGVFEGIGAYLSQDPDTLKITVVRPIKNSPAEEVGIMAEDEIVEVDGEDITGQDLNVVVSKVRGPEGSKVVIGIRRAGEADIIKFDVKRGKINEESVTSEMLDDNIGYIYISEFADATGSQFRDAYDDLKNEGMESLILDLRYNGGGYVDTSVEVADKLIKDGDIVSIKDRHGSGYTYEDKGDKNYCDIPIVVLVNDNTASASEILTGALKDYGIATIIGTNTFGKGIVQDVLPLGDGSGMKITNSYYYTPKGNNIHKIGITPDYVVEIDADKLKDEGIDTQLEAAKNFLTKGTIE